MPDLYIFMSGRDLYQVGIIKVEKMHPQGRKLVEILRWVLIRRQTLCHWHIIMETILK